MGTYVGKWDCPRCGTKRIPGWANGGTVETCPACGGPTTGKWYLDERDMEIGNPEEIAKAQQKRAWSCGHCGKVNDGSDDSCDACGNPKDAGTDDKQFISREYDPRDVPQSTDDIEAPNTESVTENAAATEQGMSRPGRERMAAEAEWRKKMLRRRWMIGGGIVGGLVLMIFILLWRKEIPVVVTGFAWEREIDIEVYGPHNESSWDSPPAGAYNVSSAIEVHHYNTIVVGRDCHTESHSVVCGTTDNGNGTFTDRYCDESQEVCVDRTVEEPVYATKYYYTIDRWGFDHTEKTEAKDHSPHWPSYGPTVTQPNKYREGKKREEYHIETMRHSGSRDDTEVKLDRWQATRPGQTLVGYKNVVFGYWMGLKD